MELRLEVLTVPVSDVDASIEFYTQKLGFNIDMDVQVSESVRFVQLTAPGSACSIHLSTDESIMKPGDLHGAIFVVDSADDAKRYFEQKGLELSDVAELGFGKHVYFNDPDGNGWVIQESYSQNRARQNAQ